ASKVIGTTLNVVDKTGKVLSIGISANDFGNQAAYMIDKYMVNGEDVSWETAYEVLALGATGFQVTQFTKMGVSSFDTPSKSASIDASGNTKYGVVEDSMIENIADGKAVDYADLPGGDKFSSASDKGGFSSGGCFVAGTKVKTPEGEKNIEDIKVGDEVYAYNSDTEETDIKKVLQTFVHESDEIAHVTISSETIDATTNHPFYVVGYGFIPAGELRSGDVILLLDGITREVEAVSIEYLEQPVKVYNFEVEDWHTYFVSEQGVLVHNKGCQAEPWDIYTKKIQENSIDVSGWNKGSFDSAEESIAKHYYKHANEVGASSIEQYMRKAEGFKINLKGATKNYVDGTVDGVIRYKKSGKYIDLAPDGTIISFGKTN
ncbi:MAG: Hint domain-containing protein, partial [Lachnospiraceae bacterium]|nr:Hint domain-containing protein [Lachnospiraceae bacterium]